LRVFLRSCNRNDAASKGITATRTLAAEARAAAVPPWRTRVYPAAGTMPRAIHVDSWRLAPPTPPGNSRASAVAGCCKNDAASIRAGLLHSRLVPAPLRATVAGAGFPITGSTPRACGLAANSARAAGGRWGASAAAGFVRTGNRNDAASLVGTLRSRLWPPPSWSPRGRRGFVLQGERRRGQLSCDPARG